MKNIVLTYITLLVFGSDNMAQVPFCVRDTFANMASMAISSNDAALINDKIYTVEAYSTPHKLTEYNISTGIANVISAPPFTLGETSITGYNNKLYFFGGYTGSTSNLAKMYNISTNTWTSLANLPFSITQASAVTLNNFIYITGATLGSTVQYFLKYDPALNTYTTLAVPAVMFSNSKLVVYNSNIYCLGGHGSSGLSNKLSLYNLVSNSWSSLAPMPFSRTKITATVWGSYLYVFGGATTPLFTPKYEYFAYNFLNNTWVTSSEVIPVAMFSGAVSYADTIYIPNGNLSKKYYCGTNCSSLTVSASSSNICSGQTISLTATGATNYTWSPGALTGSVVTVSPLANTVYTVIGNSSGFCSNTKTISIDTGTDKKKQL